MAKFLSLLVLSILFIALYVELGEAKQAAKKPAVVNHARVNIKKQAVKTNRATTNCVDKASNCKQMLSHCFESSYASLLKTNCALTCGHCVRPAAKCEDGYGERACKNWDGQGYCRGSATVQQKRAYCSKTCRLCENSGNPQNTPSNSPTNNKPPNSPQNTPQNKPQNGKCTGDNEFKGDACLKQNCMKPESANNPACIRFCENKKNKDNEIACICADDPYSDDRCMPQFCKANPTDSACTDFCDEDENKNSKECVCIKNDLDPSCLKDTCKVFAKSTDSGCKRMCTQGTNLIDEPACVMVNQTDCSVAANKFNLACIKIYDGPTPVANTPNGGTNCADPTPDAAGKKNMDDSGCKNFCMANKNHKSCVNCADNTNLHFHCLNVNCKPASPKKDDSACKTYCKKNPADCT